MAIKKTIQSGNPLSRQPIRVVELFAGVGGFHLGLQGVSFRGTRWKNNGYEVVWANQWEPPGSPRKQFAYECYQKHLGKKLPRNSLINKDIAEVLDEVESGDRLLPECDMLVGGFPCQDYSVARPLPHAKGIQGKKGVLWWEIYRMLELYGEGRPRYLILENVDRMLKSPASQRGRDFAIMLSCLANLGYSVEWRIINAAEYGFPQRRRRVFVYAELTQQRWNLKERLLKDGVQVNAFPVRTDSYNIQQFEIESGPYELSNSFGVELKKSPFENAGVMQDFKVATTRVAPHFTGRYETLSDVLISESDVPEEFFIDEKDLPKWEYHKDGKRIDRISKVTGHTYQYAEGGMKFPDPIDRPARTILTSEGGGASSRAKHAIATPSGKIRRLVPDELDVLSGFPKGWTGTGMTDAQRAFCVGNALVVGVVRRLGREISKRHQAES